MKKMAMLLAAACAAPWAGAQQAVELYGLIDVGVESLSHANPAGDSVVRMTGANMAGSRWGLRGQEALDGGVKALFNLESGFRPDSGGSEVGGQTGRLFGRVATVGLSGAYGTLLLGRQAIVMNDVMFQFDPMAFALYGLATLDGKFFGRVDNAVKYQSPVLNGLAATGYYSVGADTVNGEGEVAGHAAAGRAYGLGATYAAGPLNLGAVYDHANPTSVAKTIAGNQDVRTVLAASYQAGLAKAYLGYRHLRSDVAGTPGVHSGLAWAGVGYLAAPQFKLTGALYRNDVEHSAADARTWVLNADYLLSRRTDLYAGVSHVTNGGTGATASNVGVTGGPDAVAPGAGAGQTGMVLGLRHKF